MIKKCVLIVFVLLVVFSTNALATSINAYPKCTPHDVGCDFEAFIESVTNGDGSELVGVFVYGKIESPVIQQPVSITGKTYTGYVSYRDEIVTQFSLAARYGVIGLLAHVDRVGEKFHLLEVGEIIFLVMGDGKLIPYRVVDKNEYQKLTPGNNWSYYRDTSNNEVFTTYQVFSEYYQTDETTLPVTLQTCVVKNGLETWGLVFISAEPIFNN